ncbi:MAG: cell division protein FtsZ [Thermoplasmata archaeon]
MKSLLRATVQTRAGNLPVTTERTGSLPAEGADDAEIAKVAESLKVHIRIVGCGGGGSNTVDRCVEAGILETDLCAINTDARHLLSVRAPRKILIGRRATRGLGAGDRPEIGEEAARENQEELQRYVQGAHIVFVTAGMGGGTGTGAAPLVARLAKEAGALAIGVVTMPFSGEGPVRMQVAREGLERLRRTCDTTVVIQNDRVRDLVPRMPVQTAFKLADTVLMTTIKGIAEIVTQPGLVNLDYADLLTIMKDRGVAFVGLGESSSGPDRVTEAITGALTSPLLGDMDLHAATGVLVRVTGGPTMTVSEAEKAARIVGAKVSPRARILWGCSVDPSPEMAQTIRVLLIITGVTAASLLGSDAAPGTGEAHEGIDFVR